MGEKYANLEEAIACISQALEIFTFDSYPLGYAYAQMSLGAFYSQRLMGEEYSNQEEAIACYNRALQVCTPEDFPEDYASAQNNLGNIYSTRIAGERSTNLEEAIACYNRALQVHTAEDFPEEYAKAMHNLGHCYSTRILGEQHANLEEAIACYNRALQVFTLDAFPFVHRWVQLDLADAAEYPRDWELVHEAYTGALAAEDRLFPVGAGVRGRDAILKEGRNAAVRDGFALIRLSRIAEAAVAVEQGRARGLAEAMALRATDPLFIHDPALGERYEYALKLFTTAQAVLNAPIRTDFDPDTYSQNPSARASFINQAQRTADRERTAAYHQAREEFDAVVTEIRTTQGNADFLSSTLKATTILQASGQCGQAHALVYLASTTRGGFAVAAFSSNSKLGVGPHFATLDLPRLNDFFVDDLIGSALERENNFVLVCSFADAQAGGGFDRLLSDWEGPTFRECVALLHAACLAANKQSTLDAAAQEMLNLFPLLAQIAYKPLDQLSSSERATLAGTLGRFYLQYELKRCLPALAEVALNPLSNWLREEGTASVTLVPCGALAAFPLLAAEIAPGQVMSDIFVTSVAPSARSLLYKDRKVEARSGIFALGDPRPTFQELKWGEAEAHTLVQLAHELSLPAETKVHDEATRDWLVDALYRGVVVDASCHGYFNIDEPLQSSLRLAQQEVVTLGDMLNYNVDLRGLRLLILSACQTAILDLSQGARDEVRSFAAGVLQAGAKAVLASLWSVDDKATYLLMTRFAQEWFPNLNVEPPAAALVRAQHWLRNVTNNGLQEWQAVTRIAGILEDQHMEGSALPTEEPEGKQEVQLGNAAQPIIIYETSYRYSMNEGETQIRSLAVRRNKPYDCFYADPIYWAGFQIIGW